MSLELLGRDTLHSQHSHCHVRCLQVGNALEDLPTGEGKLRLSLGRLLARGGPWIKAGPLNEELEAELARLAQSGDGHCSLPAKGLRWLQRTRREVAPD